MTNAKTTDRKLLKKIVKAWESLQGGRNYTPREIGNWLADDMKPVMDDIRAHLKQEKKKDG